MKLIYTTIIALAISAFANVEAQDEKRFRPFSNMEVGPSAGILNFYGDLKNFGSFTLESGGNESSLGYGLLFYKGFSEKKIFGIEAGILGGKLQGTNSDRFNGQGLTFESNLLEFSAAFRLNILSLLSPENATTRKFGWIGFAGVGLATFDTQMFQEGSSAELPINPEVLPSYETGESSALAYFFGGRFTYKVHENWHVGMETSLRLTNSDLLDSYAGGGTSGNPESINDMYSYTAFSVAYHFGKGDKKRPPTKPDVPLIADDPKTFDPVQGNAEISGVFEYQDLPKEGVEMELVDENGDVLRKVVTGPDGDFEFKDLKPDEVYMVRLAEKDVDKFSNGNVYVLNDDGEKVVDADKVLTGTYQFKAHPKEKLAQMDVIPDKQPVAVDTPKEDPVKKDLPKVVDPVKKEDVKKTPVVDEPVKVDPKPTPQAIADNSVKIKRSGAIDFSEETIFFRHNSFWVSRDQNNTKGSVIAKKLKESPGSRIAIFGFASTVGSEDYNQLLSQRRADKLKSILVERFSISSDRIVAIGKGEVEDETPDEQARKAEIREIE